MRGGSNLQSGATLATRLGFGVVWTIASTILLQGSTLIANAISANLLGRNDFGSFSMVQSTVVTISNLAQLGLGLTVTKYVAELRIRDGAAAGRILGLCRAVSIISGLTAALGLYVYGRWLAIE